VSERPKIYGREIPKCCWSCCYWGRLDSEGEARRPCTCLDSLRYGNLVVDCTPACNRWHCFWRGDLPERDIRTEDRVPLEIEVDGERYTELRLPYSGPVNTEGWTAEVDPEAKTPGPCDDCKGKGGPDCYPSRCEHYPPDDEMEARDEIVRRTHESLAEALAAGNKDDSPGIQPAEPWPKPCGRDLASKAYVDKATKAIEERLEKLERTVESHSKRIETAARQVDNVRNDMSERLLAAQERHSEAFQTLFDRVGRILPPEKERPELSLLERTARLERILAKMIRLKCKAVHKTGDEVDAEIWLDDMEAEHAELTGQGEVPVDIDEQGNVTPKADCRELLKTMAACPASSIADFARAELTRLDEVHDIGWAVARLREGKRLRRPCWSTDAWVEKRAAGLVEGRGSRLLGSCQIGRLPLFATDWQLAEDQP